MRPPRSGSPTPSMPRAGRADERRRPRPRPARQPARGRHRAPRRPDPMGEPGGAVLHAALAAALWGAKVGICSVAGTDYPAARARAPRRRGDRPRGRPPDRPHRRPRRGSSTSRPCGGRSTTSTARRTTTCRPRPPTCRRPGPPPAPSISRRCRSSWQLALAHGLAPRAPGTRLVSLDPFEPVREVRLAAWRGSAGARRPVLRQRGRAAARRRATTRAGAGAARGRAAALRRCSSAGRRRRLVRPHRGRVARPGPRGPARWWIPRRGRCVRRRLPRGAARAATWGARSSAAWCRRRSRSRTGARRA